MSTPMPPSFASVQKAIDELRAFIDKRIEGYLAEHSVDDDDYDPDSIVDDLETGIGNYLQGLDYELERLTIHTEQEEEARVEIDRTTKSILRNTRYRLIEIGCTDEYLQVEDWFPGYLEDPLDD